MKPNEYGKCIVCYECKEVIDGGAAIEVEIIGDGWTATAYVCSEECSEKQPGEVP